MPSTRPEDFLSTVRTTAARPGQVLDVVVLTADAGLLETLRSAAGSEHALWEAPSANAAVDHLVGGRCDVLIADLGTLGGDVSELIERLQAQFPELIFMVTGRREEEGAVASLLSTGRIYRFLHKPISPGRAFQFLNAATRRYNELRDIQPVALQAVRTVTRKRPYLGKAVAAATGIVAAVVAFTLWQSQERGLPATLQTTHVGDAPVEDVIKAKLGSAQIAYLSGRLIDPRGDNALEYYKGVLALQSDHAEAKAGVRKVIDTLEQRVVKALEERSAPRVVTAWRALQRAAPDHPRLDALRAQLLALSRTQRPASAVANNTRPRVEAATQSVASDAFATNVPPAGDSASDSSLATAPEVAPAALSDDSTAADAAERELAEAIARELAEQEAAAGAQLAEQVTEAPVPRGATVEEEIAAEQEQLSAAPAERDVATDVVQAASLKRLREVPPAYPREAQRAGTEGWVQVEFTIAPDGSTRDLNVRDSEPAQVFDKAALDSVSKWRFEPVRRNGELVAQRAMLQVRFVLND